MRLVIWSTTFAPSVGGLQRFSAELATGFAEKGIDVTVLTETPRERAADDAWPFRTLRGASHAEAVRMMRVADVVQIAGVSLRGLERAWLAAKRPFLTHAGPHAVCPAGLAWSDSGECGAGPTPGPCAYCPSSGLRGRVDVTAHRMASRFGAHNVFVSRYLSDRVGLPGSIIYNPIPNWLFEPGGGERDGDLIVAAGRLVREKGFDCLLLAMRGVDARLAVAGAGPERARLESLVERVGVEGKVTFLGALCLDALVDLYRRGAIACVPTIMGEPFGYAVAEAMAVGIPVVGAPTGAIPELLADDRGYLASSATPEALATTILEALGDPKGRARRAATAARFAREALHTDVVCREYEELYTR